MVTVLGSQVMHGGIERLGIDANRQGHKRLEQSPQEHAVWRSQAESNRIAEQPA